MKRFLSRAFPRMGPTASTSKDSGFVFALKICLSSITPFALCIKVGNAFPTFVVFTQSRKRISTLVLKRSKVCMTESGKCLIQP